MPAIITNKFRIRNTAAFISAADIESYYVTMGRPQPWADEIVVDSPIDSVQHELEAWDDTIGMKKITSSNISHGIQNRAWNAGEIYDIYRHDYGKAGVTGVNGPYTSLEEAKYYVVGSDYRVFMCISNNNGAPSTDDPTAIVYDAHKIGVGVDNYIWKLIAKSSAVDTGKFSTLDWHPVLTLAADPGPGSDYTLQWECQQASIADAGGIFHAVVGAGGGGYGNNLVNAPGIVSIVGDGSGAVAVVNTNGTGAITNIRLTSYGTGYTWAKLIFSGGAGATGTAIISPAKGLGADPVNDLLGMTSIVNMQFEYNDGGKIPTSNDYRRIGLLVNPTEYAAPSTVLSMAVANAMTTIAVTPVGGVWALDSIVEDNTTHAKGIIVDIQDGTGLNAGKKVISIIRTEAENSTGTGDGSANFGTGNTIITVVGGAATGTIFSITPPDVAANSGNLIYIENRRFIQRAADQIENITFCFKF